MSKIIHQNRGVKNTFIFPFHLLIISTLFTPFFALLLMNFTQDNSLNIKSSEERILSNSYNISSPDNYSNVYISESSNIFQYFKFDFSGVNAICLDLEINLNFFNANSESFILNEKHYLFDDVKQIDSLIVIVSDYYYSKNKNNDDLSNYFFSFLPELSIDSYESDYRLGLSISFTDIVNTLTDIDKAETDIKNSNRDLFIESRELIANYLYQLINYFKELEMLNFEIVTEKEILEAMQKEFLDTRGNVSFQDLNSQKINMKNLDLRLFNLNNNIKLDMFKFKSLLGFR